MKRFRPSVTGVPRRGKPLQFIQTVKAMIALLIVAVFASCM